MEASNLDKLLGLDSPELLVLAKEVEQLHCRLRESKDLSSQSAGWDRRNSELKALRAKVKALRTLAGALLGFKLEMIIVDCE